MEHQLVVFELATEHYGVDIAAVESIIKMQSITAVPQSPDFVEGVTNLRGSVLPVIDLRKRFGLEVEDTTKDSRIIVIIMNNFKVGMIVDAVSEVLRVSDDAIEPPPPMIATVDTTFVTGIAKLGISDQEQNGKTTRLVILLDLAKVLSLDEQADLLAIHAAPTT